MNNLLQTGFSILLLASVTLAAPPPVAISEATQALLTSAQTLAKDAKADLAAVVAAHEQALQAADLPADRRMKVRQDLIRVYTSRGLYEDAAKDFDRALGAADLTPAQRAALLGDKAKMWFESNFRKGGFASYSTDGIDRAAEVYAALLALPGCPDSGKVAAYQGMADCHLEKMDTKAANAALDEALKLPGLDAQDLFTARKNKADALYRELDYEAALAVYQSLWSETLKMNLRTMIENRIASCLAELKRADEAVKLMDTWKRSPMDLASFYLAIDRPEKAADLYERVLADPAGKFNDRAAAAEKLLLSRVSVGDYTGFFALAERWIPELIAVSEKGWDIYPKLLGFAFTRWGANDNPDYTLWVAQKVVGSPKVSASDTVKYNEVIFKSCLGLTDIAQAKSSAELILAKEIDLALRLRYSLALAVLDSNGKAAGIEKKIESVFKAQGDAADTPTAKADALLQASRTALTVRFEEVARAIYTMREGMLVREPLRSLDCTFVENGPVDITGFLNSAHFKNVTNRARLDRKYGDNLQFLLETDSALTGRKVTEQKSVFKPTEFVATCDADGVRIFFVAYTDKARDIADGLTSLGGYELYLAPGADVPYLCYLIGQAPGAMVDSFVTQYDNAAFRNAVQKEGNVKVEHRVLDNGVATLLTFSWKVFFNRVPAAGDAWAFEAIHWEQCGYSWGGSKSVHNRSSFGSLVFANMTPDNLRTIKRRLVAAAAAAYRRELSARNNGCMEIWQDPELGDRRFYAEVIKPLQDSLDVYLAKAKAGMTDEDVDLLFAEAVPRWMNIQYVVADLRRDYLDRRRIAGE